MEKFRVYGTEIQKLKVIKETEKQIVYISLHGSEFREAKVSQWAVWFNNFEEAKEYLINKFTLLVKNKEDALTITKENLEKVTKLNQ